MGEPDDDGQMELSLELREAVAAPRWAEAIMWETEGNQDTGHWGA